MLQRKSAATEKVLASFFAVRDEEAFVVDCVVEFPVLTDGQLVRRETSARGAATLGRLLHNPPGHFAFERLSIWHLVFEHLAFGIWIEHLLL